MRRIFTIVFCCLLAAEGFWCGAQGFDDLKKSKPAQLNTKLQSLVDNNDTKGLERYLKSKSDAKDGGSSMGRNERGAANVIPLINDVIDRTLQEKVSLDLCRVVINAGSDVYSVYNGKTPVYQLMDYFARTPSENAETGMRVLDMLLERKDFDINRRYRSLPPPMSYLLSENFRYLGNRYDRRYLSTDLLQSMLGHGANLNSYDENGGSLLLLATSTDNLYLRNYLLDHGVNIDKIADTSGNNAIYAAIKDSDVEMLKRIISNYNIKLTTEIAEGHKGPVSQEMFLFLATECARNAHTYEEVMAFKNHFLSRQDLVQQKYESLARSETQAASDFASINQVVQRYPDLDHITKDKRLSIYHNDAVKVDAAYKSALAAARSGKPANIGSLSTLNEFIANYGEKSRYDPEDMVSKARRAVEFQTVCDGLTLFVSPNYYDKERFLASVVFDRPYYFEREAAQKDTATIGRAIRVANRGRYDDQCVFQSFYQDNMEALFSKESQLYASINRSIDFVNSENAKARSNRSSSGYVSSSSSSSSSSETSSSASEEVDIEAIGMPAYEWETDWYRDGILTNERDGVTNKVGEVQLRKIKFPGVGTGKIFRRIEYSGFWSSKEKYETIDDAIIAEYVFQKYGKVRKKGQTW